MRKLAIILLSFFPLLAGAALSPSLAEISSTFPEVSELWIKSLVTIPSICVVLGQFFQMNLSKKVTPKYQVLLGFVLYACGAIPFIWSSFAMLIMSRIILGVGLSLLVPNAISLIQTHFMGKERDKMLGYSSGLNNLGTVVAVIYSGLVSANNWRWVFLIYLLALISFVFSAFFLPNEKHLQKTKQNESSGQFSLQIVFVWAKMFLLTVVYFIIPTNLSFYILTQFHQKNPLVVGVLMGIISLFGVISGLVFSYFPGGRKVSTQEIFVIIFFTLSMCLLSFAQVLSIFIIGLFMSGWALGWGLPCLNSQLISVIPDKASNFLGIGQAMIFLGQFLSPFMISFLAKSGHQSNPFIIGVGLMIVFSVISVIEYRNKSHKLQ